MSNNGARCLGVEESGREGLLGGVGVLLFLLTLAFLRLAVGGWRIGVFGGRHDALSDAVGDVAGRSDGLHGSIGCCSDTWGQLEAFKFAIFAGEDRRRVLHVLLEEVVEARLDVGEALLQAGKGHDDLVTRGSFSSCTHRSGSRLCAMARG